MANLYPKMSRQYLCKTEMGCWALICDQCFKVFGIGLGAGKGQKYDLKTLEKLAG